STFTPKPNTAQELKGDTTIATLPEAFKAKVKAAMDLAAAIKDPGPKPDDPDDSAGMAAWESKKKAYDDALAAYQEAVGKVVNDDAYGKYSAVIGAGSLFDPDRTDVVTYSFFT